MADKQDKNIGVDEKLIEPFLVKDPDAFAVNMARMVEAAGKAASAWLAPREAGQKAENFAEPLVDVAKTLSSVTEYWLSDPRRALEAQTMLYSQFLGVWSNAIQRASGAPVEDLL